MTRYKKHFKLFRLFVLLFLIIVPAVFSQTLKDASNKSYNENLAGIYSSLFPGAGYFYLNEPEKALISTGLILPIAANYYITTPGYTGMSLKKNLYFSSVNIARFQAYDAYHTALNKNGNDNRLLNIKHYKFSEFYSSIFKGDTYKFEDSPSYTIFIPLTMIAAVPAVKLIRNGTANNLKLENALLTVPLIFIQSLLFSIGEESYFRGYVYPAASELTGSKLAGNLIQSMYFGFCHTDISERIGFRQFPHISGTLFHFTSTIDDLKEYVYPETPSGNFSGMKDLQRFALFTGLGFGLGVLTSEYKDGLLKTTLLHTAITFASILTDYLTEGSTGRFCMEFRLK